MRATSGALDGEVLDGIGTLYGQFPLSQAAGNRLSLVSTLNDLPWPDSTTPQNLNVVTWIDAGPGTALASAPSHSVRSLPDNGDGVFAQVAWPDRVLLLQGSNQLSTRIVWTNAGTAD